MVEKNGGGVIAGLIVPLDFCDGERDKLQSVRGVWRS